MNGSAAQSKDQAREGANINKSLASFSSVMQALATGARHVPYRDSKLTHVLQVSSSNSAVCARCSEIVWQREEVNTVWRCSTSSSSSSCHDSEGPSSSTTPE